MSYRTRLWRIQRRRVGTQIGVAAILLILGIGNLVMGHQRLLHYQTALSDAQTRLARPESNRRPSLWIPPVNIDQQTRHILRVRSKLRFYQLVIGGGRILTAAGALLLGWALITVSRAGGGLGQFFVKRSSASG